MEISYNLCDIMKTYNEAMGKLIEEVSICFANRSPAYADMRNILGPAVHELNTLPSTINDEFIDKRAIANRLADAATSGDVRAVGDIRAEMKNYRRRIIF